MSNDIELIIRDNADFTSIIALEKGAYEKAIGGCRVLEYESLPEAIDDAIALCKAMSKKLKILNLPFNGGKNVVVKKANRAKDLSSITDFINSLNGKYISGCDVNTTTEDILWMQRNSKYIAGAPIDNHDYMSDFTAHAVITIIEASVKKLSSKTNKNLFEGKRVFIQGLGKIGTIILDVMHRLGAKLYISDIDKSKCEYAEKKYNAIILDSQSWYKNKFDIVIPCAMGGLIDETIANEVSCELICGPANNQLRTKSLEKILHERNILFIPDFLASLGGVFYAASTYQIDRNEINIIELRHILERKVLPIVDAMLSICFEKNITTTEALYDMGVL